MGIRQSLGLFMQPLTVDIGISISGFTLAIAVQNLLWGVFQPMAGALAARYGFRMTMVVGALFYVGGLAAMALAQGEIALFIGAGVMIDAALACTGLGLSLAVAANAADAARRSMILGIVSAAGSLGAVIAAPLGQGLIGAFDWRVGIAGFVVMALLMLPAAWLAGRVDQLIAQRHKISSEVFGEAASAFGAFTAAFRSSPFMVMSCAYFVCGMQLVFLTTHLPSYLAICGMNPMLSAQALSLIAVFNVFGSLFFGWAGGRWNKQALLGLIYVTRSLILGWYFFLPPSPVATLVFASLMGFLWLGVGPLMAGAVVEMFGLRWQAMINGIAFFGHQIGSFVGALGGGWIFERLGSYDLAWQLAVGIGLTAGFVQIICAFALPHGRGPQESAA